MAAEDNGSPSVRWIRGARAWLESHRREARLGLTALILLAIVTQGIYTVENGESAAVLRFGRLIDDAVGSGMSFRLPMVDEVFKARTGEVFRLTIEGDFVPELPLLSGDENILEATLVVQYRISRLGEFLFATENPEELIRQAVRAALVESFAGIGVDELLTSAKAAVQNQVREAAQGWLESYGVGVSLVAVNLQAVNPPFEAAGAFRAVSDARAEAGQTISRAQGERERGLRLARGQAGQIRQEAEASAVSRQQGAQGAADRFEHLLVRQRLAPGQTRTELYADAVQEILPRARLVVLASGEKPSIDVQLIQRGGETSPLPPLPIGEEP